jgi:hypothetical protein
MELQYEEGPLFIMANQTSHRSRSDALQPSFQHDRPAATVTSHTCEGLKHAVPGAMRFSHRFSMIAQQQQ